MSARRWRAACLAVGAVCLVLLWRDCGRAPAEPRAIAECAGARVVSRAERAASGGPRRSAGVAEGRAEAEAEAEAEAGAGAGSAGADDGMMLYGVRLPGWAMWLAPHPGEDLRAYRDRMLPLAVAAIAPQRARVARSRDSFAELAHLDGRQRAELDAAVDETATALQERVLNAVLGGELAPATFKPMAGAEMARDLLDIVGRGNRRFVAALRADQRAALAQHPFDFGDYLVFSTRWEEALKLL
jgi:hypothetical protein